MKYCHHCAAPLVQHVPPGDDKLRYCCQECDTIFYQNPKNVVGTVPIQGDCVLLCKRAIEPRLGKWTLPAGFMENGESSLDGAIRETFEESGARIQVSDNSLYTLFNLPAINQVHVFFRAKIISLDAAFSGETSEIGLFSEAEIPWHELAFPVIRSTLEHYFQDLPRQQFPVRMFDIQHEVGGGLTTTLISHSHGGDQ